MKSELCPSGTPRRFSFSRFHGLILCFFVLFFIPFTFYQVFEPIRIFSIEPVLQSNRHRAQENGTPTFRKNCTYTTGSGTFDVSQIPERLKGRKLMFPKVIHRTWKDENVPERWEEGVRSCQQMNVDYGYCHWTDEDLENFISQVYPWFLNVYLNYAYPIQRIDAVRYFLLLHYGGVYIDLDYTCKAPFETSLSDFSNFEIVLAETVPTGVTNGFMTSTSGHPFWRYLVENLSGSNIWYGVPYATVMFSTGPMFVSLHLESYKKMGLADGIGIISKEVLAKDILGHLVGNSWHCWDARFAIAIYSWRYFLCSLVSLVILGLLILVVVVCVRRSRNKSFSVLTSKRSHDTLQTIFEAKT